MQAAQVNPQTMDVRNDYALYGTNILDTLGEKMEPNYTLRVIVLLVLIVLNAINLIYKEKLSGFDKVIHTWAMTYMMYYGLKSLFGF